MQDAMCYMEMHRHQQSMENSLLRSELNDLIQIQ